MQITPALEQRIFNTLDVIRESGKINMFEAPRHIADMFDINKRDARDVFIAWTKQFNKETV